MKKFVLFSVFVVFGCLNAFGADANIAVGTTFDVGNYRYTVTAIVDGSHTKPEVSISAVPEKKTGITDVKFGSTATLKQESIPGVITETVFLVTSVADEGFKGCTNISSIEIPSSVKRIGTQAFRDRTNPFTVKFNEGLEVIGNRAFCKSTGLHDSVVFPKSLKTIEDQAFGGCDNVSYIEFLSESLVDIQGANFAIGAVTANGYIVDVMYVPEGQGPVWREEYSKKSYRYPFANKKTETVVGDYLYDIYDIYDQPTEDGARVSEGWKKQCPANVVFEEYVTIGGKTRSVTDVKASCFNRGRAFWGNIKTIKFPHTMRRIGKEAFRSIDSTFTIELNEGLKVIGDRAFCRSTGLRGTTSRNDIGQSALVIPSSVDTIRSHAFYNCTSITDSVIMQRNEPPTVPAGEGFLFGNVPAVVRIPCESVSAYKAEGTNYWSTRTVYDPCDDDIVLGPNFMYRIIDKENRYLSLLGRRIVCDATVTVPSSLVPEGKKEVYYVKKIAAKAFNASNLLDTLIISAGVDTIESDAFLQNQSLRQVTVAAKVIGSSAFNACSALQEVILKEGVETIKDRAFIRCYALTDVTFPSSIQHIEDYAFYLDTLITDITFLGVTAPTLGGPNILGAKKGLENIWVPCGAYWNYYGTGIKDRWDALRDYLRSGCRELDLKEGEDIAADETVSSIALHRTFNINEWTPLYLPFAVDSVLAVIDGVHYDINYPYSAKYGGGYFYLQKFHEIHNEQVCFTAADTIETGVNYIIRFPDDYFSNMEIVFKTKAREYNVTATPSLSEQTSSTYVLAGNNGYTQYDGLSVGYLMEGASDGTISFVRHIPCTVSPFSFVLLPPAQLQANPSKAPLRLRMRTSEDKDDNVTTSVSNTKDSSLHYCYDGEQLTIYPAGSPCTIHSMDGALLYTIDGTQESVVLHLPAGLYIANSKGNCQKILL